MNCNCHDDDIDDLFNEEEEVTFLESIRSKRLQEFSNFPTLKPNSVLDTSDTWGYLTEMSHEKEVMHLSTTLPRLLIHFYNPSFKNCQLLNEHLHVIFYLKSLYSKVLL